MFSQREMDLGLPPMDQVSLTEQKPSLQMGNEPGTLTFPAGFMEVLRQTTREKISNYCNSENIRSSQASSDSSPPPSPKGSQWPTKAALEVPFSRK